MYLSFYFPHLFMTSSLSLSNWSLKSAFEAIDPQKNIIFESLTVLFNLSYLLSDFFWDASHIFLIFCSILSNFFQICMKLFDTQSNSIKIPSRFII